MRNKYRFSIGDFKKDVKRFKNKVPEKVRDWEKLLKECNSNNLSSKHFCIFS